MAAPTIQRGSKLLGDTLTSMTIVRGTDSGFNTTVDPTKTILLTSYRSASADANYVRAFSLQRELTDGDTITITRNLATSDGSGVTVQWALLSFASGVTVQHKSLASSALGSGTISLSAVDLSKTFIIQGGVTHDSAFTDRAWVEWSLSDTTTLAWARGTTASNVTAACQVVQYDGCSVQAVPVSWSGNTSATTDTTISAVTVAATALFGSMRISTSNDLVSASHVASLTSTTNLRLTRSGTVSLDGHATVYVVSFTDGSVVARYAPVHSAGTATVDTTITAVDTSVTASIDASIGPPSAGIAASTSYGRMCGTNEFTSTTTLRTTKGITSSGVTYGVDVVTFAATASGPTINTQPDDATAVVAGPAQDTSVDFTVSATTSGGTLTYQWSVNDGGGYDTIGGATSATYTLSGITAGLDGYLYRGAVTDDNGTVNSDPATLTVYAGETLTQPSGLTASDGTFASPGSLTSDYATRRVRITATCEGVTVGTRTVRVVP